MAPPTALLTPDVLRGLIEVAGRAPSLHNSQPWQFRFVGDAVELLIEPKHAMRVSDPQARELVISCGAALYNLRLAMRCQGLVPHVDVVPACGEPLLLARIKAEQGPAPTPDEQRLLSAVVHRHTHRHGFMQVPIAQTLAAAFATDTAAEGSELIWIDDPAQVTAITKLALLADQLQAGDPAWRAEIDRWITLGGREGIPRRAVPAVRPELRVTDRLPVRGFLSDQAGTRDRAGFPGRIALITSKGDQLADWLAAGQSLQRMLLRAADDWVFATYATAPLEVPALREALRDRLGLRDHPQMLLELGHAGYAHPTPRRPVDDPLDP